MGGTGVRENTKCGLLGGLLIMALSGAAPAHALEIVLATGASATMGRGAKVESAYLLAVRELLRQADGTPGRLGFELTGTPAALLDPHARGRLGAGATLSPLRNVRVGAGGLVHRDGLQGAPAATLRAGFDLSSGIVLPLGPDAGLDLSARYACLSRTLRATPAPDRFAERYWTLMAGVAFKW